MGERDIKGRKVKTDAEVGGFCFVASQIVAADGKAIPMPPAADRLRPIVTASLDLKRQIESFIPIEGRPNTFRGRIDWQTGAAWIAVSETVEKLGQVLQVQLGAYSAPESRRVQHMDLALEQNAAAMELWVSVDAIRAFIAQALSVGSGSRPDLPHEYFNRFSQALQFLDGELKIEKTEHIMHPVPAAALPSTLVKGGITPTPESAVTDLIVRLLRLYTANVVDERVRNAANALASDSTVHEKLVALDRELRIPTTASSRQLGTVLNVTRQAVEKTPWWIENRRGAQEERIEGRRRLLKDKGRRLEGLGD